MGDAEPPGRARLPSSPQQRAQGEVFIPAGAHAAGGFNDFIAHGQEHVAGVVHALGVDLGPVRGGVAAVVVKGRVGKDAMHYDAALFQHFYKLVLLFAGRVNIRLRVEDSIRQAKLDINPRLEIFDPENKSVFADYMTLDDNDFVASTSFSKAGTYRFEILDKDSGNKTSGKFYVAESSVESRDFDYNMPLLSWIAWESGGKMLDQSSISTFNPLPPTKEQVTVRNEIPLYKKWYILSLFILTFCTELFFRRRWGLL